jgi:hypothetical protein
VYFKASFFESPLFIQSSYHSIITINESTIIQSVNINEKDTIILNVYHAKYKNKNVVRYTNGKAMVKAIDSLNQTNKIITKNIKILVCQKLEIKVS